MLKFLEEHLMRFRSCFTRTATFRWFVVIIVGFIVRLDTIIRVSTHMSNQVLALTPLSTGKYVQG